MGSSTKATPILTAKRISNKMKAALIQAFGNPSFTNENLKIWKWKWPNKQIEIQLYFQAKFARSTVTFSNSAIN